MIRGNKNLNLVLSVGLIFSLCLFLSSMNKYSAKEYLDYFNKKENGHLINWEHNDLAFELKIMPNSYQKALDQVRGNESTENYGGHYYLNLNIKTFRGEKIKEKIVNLSKDKTFDKAVLNLKKTLELNAIIKSDNMSFHPVLSHLDYSALEFIGLNYTMVFNENLIKEIKGSKNQELRLSFNLGENNSSLQSVNLNANKLIEGFNLKLK